MLSGDLFHRELVWGSSAYRSINHNPAAISPAATLRVNAGLSAKYSKMSSNVRMPVSQARVYPAGETNARMPSYRKKIPTALRRRVVLMQLYLFMPARRTLLAAYPQARTHGEKKEKRERSRDLPLAWLGVWAYGGAASSAGECQTALSPSRARCDLIQKPFVIRVISIEREFGSGGGSIAKKLADKLGWALWDQEITKEVAGRLRCDVKSVEQREEKPDSTFYRLMKIFMRGSYEDRYSGTGTDLLDAESLSHLFGTLITELAERGPCVIVGRAAPYFLRDREDTFRMFLYAPYEEKLRRVKASGKSTEEAETLLETVDRDRAAFVKRYYDKTWPQRDLYHLMINSVIGDDAVIEVVLHEIDILKRRSRTR